MLINIAWRNIWRNSRRSLLVMVSLIVGVVAVMGLDGLMNGMLNQMLFNRINTDVGHIQIHKKGYRDNVEVNAFIPNKEKVEQTLRQNNNIKYFAKRVKNYGLISSSRNSTGVSINGIDINAEPNVSNIKDFVKVGKYLSGTKREILISKRTAEKLSVKLGRTVVLRSNTPDGSIGIQAYKVCGFFETFSSEFDKTNIFITNEEAQKLLNVGDNIYEYTLILKDFTTAENIDEQLTTSLGNDFEVLNFRELLPTVIMQMDMTKEMMFVINLIVGVALIFGIINTMLMAVFERIREFGVLKSIGLKNRQLFAMIIYEAFILGLFGTIAGVIVGYIVFIPFQYIGFDLSIYAESLSSYSVGAVIYPEISILNVLNMLIMMPFIAVLGAIYPAVKAVKFEPVAAMRYV